MTTVLETQRRETSSNGAAPEWQLAYLAGEVPPGNKPAPFIFTLHAHADRSAIVEWQEAASSSFEAMTARFQAARDSHPALAAWTAAKERRLQCEANLAEARRLAERAKEAIAAALRRGEDPTPFENTQTEATESANRLDERLRVLSSIESDAHDAARSGIAAALEGERKRMQAELSERLGQLDAEIVALLRPLLNADLVIRRDLSLLHVPSGLAQSPWHDLTRI